MAPSARRLALLAGAIALIPLAGPSRSGGEDVFAQEKCSLCHIRESVFFDARLLAGEAPPDLGEERVCFSCHNGSVRDDRASLWRGAQHPPPGGKGRRHCSRCHTPHGRGGWDVLAGTGVPLKGGGDALCGGCHSDRTAASRSLHAARPLAGGCGECHRAHGGTGKALLRSTKAGVCTRCHPTAGAAKGAGHPAGPGSAAAECGGCHPAHRSGGGVASPIDSRCRECHPAAAQRGPGAPHSGAAACSSCHSFHGRSGTGGRGLSGPEMRPDVLCGACHGAQSAEGLPGARGKGTHITGGRLGKGNACLSCHSVHRGVPGTRLLRTAKSYSCLECHTRQNPILETGGPALAHPEYERIAPGRLEGAAAAGRLYFGPAGEIACRTCHAVHGALPGTPLLAAGFADDGNCLWCHEEKAGAGHVRDAGGGGKSGCSVCHPVHGIAGAAADPWKQVCAKCHGVGDGHLHGGGGGSAERPKDLPLFDAKGRTAAGGAVSCPTCHEPHGAPAAAKRTRRPYRPSGFLCTACHRAQESVALTPHDLRGIAADAVCEPCHKPHGGGAAAASAEGGTTGAGDLGCRSCHRERGLGTPVAEGGHPVNIVVVRPLPPEYPLSGAGPGSRRGGTMTCSTCHNVHGTGVIPQGFGAAKLLRAFGTATGPDAPADLACVPCHTERETRHGKAACAACHPPHRAANPTDACADCHRTGDAGSGAAHVRAGRSCGSCHAIHGRDGGSAERSCAACHPRAERVRGTPHAETGSGGCAGCHPPHSEPVNAPVKRRAWEEVFPADEACLRCHRAGGPGPVPEWGGHPRSRRKVPTNYGATVILESPIVMMGRLREEGRPLFPLFADNGARGLSGRMGCLTCHDPHAGPTLESGRGTRGGGYLRDPTGVFLAEICSPCHRGDGAERVRKFHVLPRKAD